KVCDLSEVDVLITDRGIPPAMLERLREAELTVELV
ncbi:MAG: transcriptional regulator, partial [Chloroflexi bacterium]|nr:transcriptional regulator [Chloroflexota bacterium]